MSDPAFAIVDNVQKHRFEADLGDGSMAIAAYDLRGGKMVFTHTEVPAAHEGRGIASALIRFALQEARDRGLEVVPICPFVSSYIRSHPEQRDLLDEASRGRLGLT